MDPLRLVPSRKNPAPTHPGRTRPLEDPVRSLPGDGPVHDRQCLGVRAGRDPGKKRGPGAQVRLRHGQSSVSSGRGPGPEGTGRLGFCRWKRRPGKGPVQFPAPGGAARALSALPGTADPIRNGRHRVEPDLGNALLPLRPGCRVGAGHDPVDARFAQGGRRSRAKPGTAQAHLRPHPGSSGGLEVGGIPSPHLGVGKTGGRTLLREQPKRGGRIGSGCEPEGRGKAHSRNRMPRLLRLSQWLRPALGSIRHTLHDLGRRGQRLGPGGGRIRNRRPPLGSQRMALDGSRVRNTATAGASEIAGNRRQGLFGPFQPPTRCHPGLASWPLPASPSENPGRPPGPGVLHRGRPIAPLAQAGTSQVGGAASALGQSDPEP